MSWQRRITDMGNRQAKVLIIEANWDDYWSQNPVREGRSE